MTVATLPRFFDVGNHYWSFLAPKKSGESFEAMLLAMSWSRACGTCSSLHTDREGSKRSRSDSKYV